MPRLFHIYSDFMGEGDMARRNRVAHKSWAEAYKDGPWVIRGVKDSELSRNATEIGSPQPFPYFNDVLELGSRDANPEDYLVFTNMDTCFSIGITDALMEEMKNTDALSSHRYDFHGDQHHLKTPIQAMLGTFYPGSDLFCFTKKWWEDHKWDYPDKMILGLEAWDWILRELVDKYGGTTWVSGHIWHQAHSSFWYRPDIKNSHPGQLHNVRRSRAWLANNQKPLRELAGRRK